jgi:hypothetical protein
MMMNRIFYAIILTLLNSVLFAQINLATGTTGTVTGVPQSFNETRGVDCKVLSSSAIQIQSMTLGGFYCGTGGVAYVDARIYDSSSSLLLASNNDTVHNIYGGSITVPISYTLIPGKTYRISFFCDGPNHPTNNSAYEFQPQAFPYIESSGKLQIKQAYSYPADTIPTGINIFVPLVTLNIITEINEINLSRDFSVFPNPASSSFKVNYTGNLLSFEITDMLGNSVKTEVIKNSEEIDISNLNEGIYFVRLKTAEGTLTKKISIVR